VNGEEDVGVSRCGWCAHGCAGELMPEGIAKLEHVVPYDKGEGLNEGIGGDLSESIATLVNVLSNFNEGLLRVDIGIHGFGVSGEDSSSRWKWVQGHEHILQISRVLDVRFLGGGNGLEMCVYPDTKVIQKAAAARDYWLGAPWVFMDF